MNEENRWHKVGEFWVHFPDDLQEISQILIDNGYGICESLDGDIIIMKPDSYDEEDFDDDEDDITPDGYHPSGE